MNYKVKALILITLAIWVLSGCFPAAIAKPGTHTAVAPIGILESSATLTDTTVPEPIPSDTIAPTPVPSATATNTPTPAPSPTITETPPPETVRFAVIGDYGAKGSEEQAVADLVKSWNPDFVITVGDNNYPLGSAETIDDNIGQYYHQFIAPYKGNYGQGADINRFFPVLGNHDWIAAGAKPYMDYFTLPGNGRYYAFNWGPVAMFAIDSDELEPDGFRKDSVQANWLKEQLATWQAPWKIVYDHYPPYSSGLHGSTVYMRWPFEEWGASAVLSGHDHTYERLQIGNIPYFVNGLGGASVYNLTETVEGSQVRYNKSFGAMLVEATAQKITFQFITSVGEVIDTYTMNK